MKRAILLSVFCLAAQGLFARTYKVSSQEEFEVVAVKIMPGDIIIIKNGNYTNWSVRLSTVATKSKPVIVRAETKDQVIFSGQTVQTVFKLTGSFISLENIVFKDCILSKTPGVGLLINIDSADHCRVTDCSFSHNEVKGQFMPLVVISGKSDANRFDHNYFENNINNQDVQVRIAKDVYPVKTLIDHNTFKNKDKVTWANFNGGECIQIGQDPILLGNAEPRCVVRDNYFFRCNAEPEVISNKSSGNKYINNTLENCDGELVMRGGHDCQIDSNKISGGVSGIRINGTGHQIMYNTISSTGTGIRLMYGMARGKTVTGFYIAADNNVIRFNKIDNVTKGIYIGDSKDVDWTGKFDTKRYPSPVMQNVQPKDNVISDNVFSKVETPVSYN